MPRNAFNFRYWVPGWANPFESRKSIYQKYAWLNEATRSEHSVLSSIWPEDKLKLLDARLSSAVLKEHRSPHVHLWEITQFANAICQACLDGGFWSELPQMAGLEQCPIHGIPLQRFCRECQQPIWFGCPRFSETGAFVCKSCDKPLTPFPEKVCLQWRSICHEVILDAFSPLASIAERIASESNGHWRLPGPSPSIEERIILHMLTGHRLKLDREVKLPFAFNELHEKVVPITFELPCNDRNFYDLLEHEQHKMLFDLSEGYDLGALKHNCLKTHLKMKMGWTTHEVDFRSKGRLAENVVSVLNSLSQARREKSNWIFEDYLKSEIETCVSEVHIIRQISRILLAFSVPQICRVLARLEFLVVTLTERLSNRYREDEISYSVLKDQPYGIRLKWGRVDEEHFIFDVDSCAWIPPYRLRSTDRGAELTIFQIS